MKRAFLILGMLFLTFAAVWQFALRNNFNQRFPDGWHWEVSSLGHSSFALESGEYPEGTGTADDPINLTERSVIAQAVANNQVHITDHYLTLDPGSNAVTWEVNYEATVDQLSGQYLEGELAGNYYFLPQNLDKNQIYAISNSSYRSLPMSFQREEIIGGINSYLYAFYGDLNNVSAYPDTALEANQTIICFDFALEYWAEPNTGEIVKFREWCEGDYVVDTTTGERLYSLSRWGAETTADDLIRRSSEVMSMLIQWQLRNLYLPLGLAGLGLILLGVGFFTKGQESSQVKKAAA
jgi:hypothetical protein